MKTSSNGTEGGRINFLFSSTSLQSLLICLVLSAMVIFVYGQNLHHEFVIIDDEDNILNEPNVLNGFSFRGVFWAFTHCQVYRWTPIATISRQIDCSLFGISAGEHHLTSLILHILASILCYVTLQSLTKAAWRSACIAALFAIHPLHVEPVSWLSARAEILCGVFFMLTIWAYYLYVSCQLSRRFYWLSLTFFTLGLMSKPMIVTVPILLLLLDYWPFNRIQISKGKWVDYLVLVREKLPFFLLSIIVGITAITTQTSQENPWRAFPLSIKIGSSLVACLVYLGKVIVPMDLAVLYPIPNNGWPIWEVLASGVLIGLISIAAIFFRKAKPYIFVGWFWYLIMILPVSGILFTGSGAYPDRYTYLPLIGIFLGLTWVFCEFKKPHPIINALLSTTILTSCIFISKKQASFWSDSVSLLSRDIDVTIPNYIAHNLKGLALVRLKKNIEAISEFHEVIKLVPEFEEGHNNLANALMLEGDISGAVVEYTKALAINSDYINANYRLGTIEYNQGNRSKGVELLKKATIISSPLNAQIANDLAWMLATAPEDDLRNGQESLVLALQANKTAGGKNPYILDTLAAAYAEIGDFENALENGQAALKIAEASGNKELAFGLKKEIALYYEGKPFRQP